MNAPTWVVPFTGHRTMAQVAETERLREVKRQRPLTGLRARRLDELLDLADMNNPPSNPKPDIVA